MNNYLGMFLNKEKNFNKRKFLVSPIPIDTQSKSNNNLKTFCENSNMFSNTNYFSNKTPTNLDINNINFNKPDQINCDTTQEIISNLRNQFHQITTNKSPKHNKSFISLKNPSIHLQSKSSIKNNSNKNQKTKIKTFINLKSNNTSFSNLKETTDFIIKHKGTVIPSYYHTEANYLQTENNVNINKKKLELKQYTQHKSNNNIIKILLHIIKVQKEYFDICINKQQEKFNNEKEKLVKIISTLFTEKQTLVNLILKIKYDIQKFHHEKEQYDNKTYTLSQQLLKENSFLRKCLLGGNHIKENYLYKVNTSKNLISTTSDNTVNNNNSRSGSVQRIEDGKDIEKDIQFKHKHQRFYTGTFSNSNVYLKQTKQKELMDNLNLTYIHYKDERSSLTNDKSQSIINNNVKPFKKMSYISKNI